MNFKLQTDVASFFWTQAYNGLYVFFYLFKMEDDLREKLTRLGDRKRQLVAMKEESLILIESLKRLREMGL